MALVMMGDLKRLISAKNKGCFESFFLALNSNSVTRIQGMKVINDMSYDVKRWPFWVFCKFEFKQ